MKIAKKIGLVDNWTPHHFRKLPKKSQIGKLEKLTKMGNWKAQIGENFKISCVYYTTKIENNAKITKLLKPKLQLVLTQLLTFQKKKDQIPNIQTCTKRKWKETTKSFGKFGFLKIFSRGDIWLGGPGGHFHWVGNLQNSHAMKLHLLLRWWERMLKYLNITLQSVFLASLICS